MDEDRCSADDVDLDCELEVQETRQQPKPPQADDDVEAPHLPEDTSTESDKEYDDLCDIIQRRDAEDRQTPDIEDEAEIDDEEELCNTDIHADLVTPELSAEEMEDLPPPPKIQYKKSHKKRSPKADRQRKSGRKLEYKTKSPDRAVPLPKPTKRKLHRNPDQRKSKKKLKRMNKKKQLQQRTIQQDGTWVQCMHSECLKWRYLQDVNDPSLIPEYWVCEHNTDPERNSCECLEEDYHSLEFVFTKYSEGSIVWAKMQGFPWWPAMIEEDPDTGTYQEQEDTDSYPTQYHVVFLDKNVSRTWLKSTSIRKFDSEEEIQTQGKSRDFKQQISQAIARAKKALSMSVQERIQTFGFSHTFKGKIVDDSSLSAEVDESDDPDSDHDNDEEDVDVDVEATDLDLEALGLDVEEILEQAESLLSEAGETMQSLVKDTSPTQDLPKKSKRGRKPGKTATAERSCEDKKDHTSKTKRKRHHESPEDTSKKSGDKTKEKKHKSSHHHRHHHHHSKKESTDEKDGSTVESKSEMVPNENCGKENTVEPSASQEAKLESSKEPAMLQEDNSADSKEPSVEKEAQFVPANDGASDLGETGKESAPKTKKARSKSSGDKVVDGSAKKTKRPYHKKAPNLNGSDVQNPKDDNTNAETNTDAKPKKIRKPRVKKPDDGSEPKAKKPRAKKAPTPKLNTKSPVNATADNSEMSNGDASGISPNPKKVKKQVKKQSKDETVPKKKPSFKPPSKNMEGTSAKVKQASSDTDFTEKSDLPSQAQKKESTTSDTITDDLTSQSGAVVSTKPEEDKSVKQEKVIDDRSPAQKKQKPRKPKTATASKIGKGDERKGKPKFSVKKTNPSLSSSPTLPSSKEILVSKMDGDSSTRADLIKTADPSVNSEKPQKLLKEVKKAAPKKFSIKHKTPTSADASDASNKSSSPSGNTETPCTKEPKESSSKSAPKKFSIKHKPSVSPENGPSLNAKEHEDTSHSQPKKTTSSQQTKTQTPSPTVDNDDILLLDLDVAPLIDDVTMETEETGRGRIDDGEDSDDFSMEDLEDWPRDLAEEPAVGGPNKLDELEASNDSQPFKIEEE